MVIYVDKQRYLRYTNKWLSYTNRYVKVNAYAVIDTIYIYILLYKISKKLCIKINDIHFWSHLGLRLIKELLWIALLL